MLSGERQSLGVTAPSPENYRALPQGPILWDWYIQAVHIGSSRLLLGLPAAATGVPTTAATMESATAATMEAPASATRAMKAAASAAPAAERRRGVRPASERRGRAEAVPAEGWSGPIRGCVANSAVVTAE